MEQIPEQAALAERTPQEELCRQQALLAADSTLRTILDAMPDLVMVLNRQRQIVFGNAALTELAEQQSCGDFQGLRPGELLACRYARSARCGCGTLDACRECGALRTIIEALSGSSGSADCRILTERPEGPEALDLRVWGTPFRWGGEEFALLVAADISHEKRRKALERIFFHDILNTAGVIDSLSEMLLQGILTVDEAKRDLRETARTLVAEIVTQRELLAAENNELAVRIDEVHAAELLENLVRMHGNRPEAAGKQIVILPESADLQIFTDPSLLSRVLGNLLKNALEASSAGETVTLECREAEDCVSFRCSNPAAIPPDAQTQVFNRSFSTKGSGRGLGTYSVKLLTEKYLKGRASFTSSGAGTTFTVTIPRVLQRTPGGRC
ncbi:MAG TPA: ATP-binding protein [Verrucomicrobiae bacterium]|nr:ATP-binding protein [Verrucomicrobiae bacterium]